MVVARSIESEQRMRPRVVVVTDLNGQFLRTESSHVPATIARAVWARDGLCCRYCGFWSDRDASKFELDHVHPRSLGGEHSMENLVVACRHCNRRKADEPGWRPLTVAQAREIRRQRHHAISQGRRWRWRPQPGVRPAA